MDFGCPQRVLIVLMDGGYHDNVVESDVQRHRHLESMGRKVLRFSDKDVAVDAEAVPRAIARELKLKHAFRPRQATGSGIRRIHTPPNS